jgi:hypothetical protein
VRLLKKCNSFFSFFLYVYENKKLFYVCICSKHLHSSVATLLSREHQELLLMLCVVKHKLDKKALN